MSPPPRPTASAPTPEASDYPSAAAPGAADEPHRHDAVFGSAVRARRAEIGITLEQLAQASGISSSALSRIERDELGTSLNYALAIAQALGCDLGDLLATPAARITRAADALRYTDTVSGITRTVVAHPAPGMQWLDYSLPPGARTPDFAPHVSGARETFYVVQGQVDITTADHAVRLCAGDSATLRGDSEHAFRNPGRSVARLLLLIAEPR